MGSGVLHTCYSYLFLMPDSTVALNSGHTVVAEYGILVHHAISAVLPEAKNGSSGEESRSGSGEESRASAQELFVLSVYSVDLMIAVKPAVGWTSSLCGCVLLLVDGSGQVTAASEWIPV